MEKQRCEEPEKRREEKKKEERRSEKRKSQKKDDLVARKGGKVANTVFFQRCVIFVAPQGRKAASLNRRVRSDLVRRHCIYRSVGILLSPLQRSCQDL